MKNFYIFWIVVLFFSVKLFSQTALFNKVLVSDVGDGNNIGSANTTRNIAIDKNGDIYVVFVGSEGIRVAKSIDRGASFLPSVKVSSNTIQTPEIAINEDSVIFVSWISNSGVFLSRSTDLGTTFSTPQTIGTLGSGAPHITTFGTNVYIVDQRGQYVYSNSTSGIGSFARTIMRTSYVYADIRTDKNGVVYVPSDDPILYLFSSNNSGANYQEVVLNPRGSVFFSSYALSDAPAGTFIFVAGNGNNGFKINATTGEATEIVFKTNNLTSEGRTLYADSFGALVDGYQDLSGGLNFSLSYDQGVSFPVDVFVANGGSHNLDRNPVYDDIDVVFEQNGQVFFQVYDGLLNSIKIADRFLKLSVCPGERLIIPFTLEGNFPDNSEFVLFLSDENGDFNTETKVDSVVVSSNSNRGLFSVIIPDIILTGNNYRLQIKSPENFIQSDIIDIAIGAEVEIEELLEIRECDEGLGEAMFDLTVQEGVIKKGVLVDANISYHINKEDAERNLNSILSPQEYVSKSVVLWARVSVEAGGVFECSGFNIAPFDLAVMDASSIISVNTITALTVCDNTSVGSDTDGFVELDLTLKAKDLLLGTQNEDDFDFEYFLDVARVMPIETPENFINTIANKQTIYVVVREKNSVNCEVKTQFDIVVDQLPMLISDDLNLKQCDIDNDGFEFFNLSEIESRILNGVTSLPSFQFNYYEEESDAILGNDNVINNKLSFKNKSKGSQIIYTRFEQQGTSCFEVIPLEIIVIPTLEVEIEELSEIRECGEGLGEAIFDLTVQEDIIKEGVLVDANISYHINEEDAEGNLNPILKPQEYTSKSVVLWARVSLEAGGAFECSGFNIASFDLVVMNASDIINVNTITALTICDNTSVGSDTDGFVELDLTLKAKDLLLGTQNEDDFDFEYFLDVARVMPIETPENFINTIANKQTIYVVVREKNSVNCEVEIQFDVVVDQLPMLISDDLNLKQCDIDNDGFEFFNLSEIERRILNGVTSLPSFQFNYYEEESDAILGNDNVINNKLSFKNKSKGSQIIYTRFEQQGTSCFEVIPLEIIVIPTPEIGIEEKYVICLDKDGFQIAPTENTLLSIPPIDTRLKESDYKFQWYEGEEVSDQKKIDLAISSSYTPSQLGFYTVEITNRISDCKFSATTEVIASYPPESISAEVVSGAFSSDNIIRVSVEGNGEYQYSLDARVWQDSNELLNVTSGEVIIYVRDILNCSSLSVKEMIINYPRFFTPNEDGFNDLWSLNDLENRIGTGYLVRVFDRYGKLLKQLTSTSAGWDGVYNGLRLPSDDYWFIVEYLDPVDGVNKQFKASLSLVR